jgi:hypothetical protein
MRSSASAVLIVLTRPKKSERLSGSAFLGPLEVSCANCDATVPSANTSRTVLKRIRCFITVGSPCSA